ncbi:hypothetical protein Acr_05g0001630 [Actinidia rufa]|uniref:Uncharacterized protein n=1 Tax=Actinidia rufa TaxID=165716 RepID=A0A7J0EJ81_9ERIC|nr:hypothetical protein Acr_05g0001630 [Actinidia rufa]
MGFFDVYEPVWASLLHRIPLPTLDQAIFELLSKETRLGLISTSHVDTTLATPSSRGRGPSGGSRGFSTSSAQPSGLTSRHNECTFCHATDHRLLVLFGFASIVASELSSSSPTPYLIDPSIEFFPEDVDVPAVLPNDTFHVAPPTIVYPVESPSTNPAPPVAPLVYLPSDLPVRRSTRDVIILMFCLAASLEWLVPYLSRWTVKMTDLLL